jgi:hypothetical protein
LLYSHNRKINYAEALPAPPLRPRGDLAGAAAAVLHDLALRDAATSLARYHQSHEAELMASLEDSDAALSELR